MWYCLPEKAAYLQLDYDIESEGQQQPQFSCLYLLIAERVLLLSTHEANDRAQFTKTQNGKNGEIYCVDLHKISLSNLEQIMKFLFWSS